MPKQFTLGRTATGLLNITIGSDIAYEGFDQYASAFVESLGLTIKEKIASVDTIMWIALLGESELCISWDDWIAEVTVMPWGNTPESVIQDIYNKILSGD